jgi:hypothetical protein
VDDVGWYIATLHDLLGHDGVAAVIGMPACDQAACVLCRHDRGEATREDVIAMIGGGP